MKKKIYLLIPLLFAAQLAWGQCDSIQQYANVNVTFDQETTVLVAAISPVNPPAATYSRIPYRLRLFLDDSEFSGFGGTSSEIPAGTLFESREMSFNLEEELGLRCENGVWTCEDCEEPPERVRFEFEFDIELANGGTCEQNGNGAFPLIPCPMDGGDEVTIDDDRQVGNTIERLGDGRISAMDEDGDIIAFSSSGGY